MEVKKKMEIEQRYAEVVNRLTKQGYEISAIGQFTTSLFLSDFATMGLSHPIEAKVSIVDGVQIGIDLSMDLEINKIQESEIQLVINPVEVENYEQLETLASSFLEVAKLARSEFLKPKKIAE